MKAVEEQADAAGIHERRTEGFERHGYGFAKDAEIFHACLGGSGLSGGRVAEVKLGMMEAKGLAAERGCVTLLAGGQDVTALDEPKHVRSPRGVSPRTLRVKNSSLSDLAGRSLLCYW